MERPRGKARARQGPRLKHVVTGQEGIRLRIVHPTSRNACHQFIGARLKVTTMQEANGSTVSPQKRIVLAESDPMMLAALTEVLSAQGYVVHPARDGLEALALIRTVTPDYIILGIVLPKLDGGKVCVAVRQDARLRHTPIIAFSDLSPQEYTFFPQVSADAYVAKCRLPIAAENLLSTLRHFEKSRPGKASGQLLGFDHFRPRQLVRDLLQERRHLRAILRVFAPEALELDCAGRIVWANPAACEILGKKEVELVGEPFAALGPSPDQQTTQTLLVGFVHPEEPPQRVITLTLNGRPVTTRLTRIMEDHTCTGLLLLVAHAGAPEGRQ
jgi:PAS domain S-box-containing protein